MPKYLKKELESENGKATFWDFYVFFFPSWNELLFPMTTLFFKYSSESVVWLFPSPVSALTPICTEKDKVQKRDCILCGHCGNCNTRLGKQQEQTQAHIVIAELSLSPPLPLDPGFLTEIWDTAPLSYSASGKRCDNPINTAIFSASFKSHRLSVSLTGWAPHT